MFAVFWGILGHHPQQLMSLIPQQQQVSFNR